MAKRGSRKSEGLCSFLTSLNIQDETGATVDEETGLVAPELELEQGVTSVTVVDLLVVHFSAGTGLHGVCEVAVLNVDDQARGSGLDVEPTGGEVVGADGDGLCSGRRRRQRASIKAVQIQPY